VTIGVTAVFVDGLGVQLKRVIPPRDTLADQFAVQAGQQTTDADTQ
jgi:hypothetical protein